MFGILSGGKDIHLFDLQLINDFFSIFPQNYTDVRLSDWRQF
jgi:hypothetical protein